MWIEAIVSKEDLVHVLADLTPTSIDLSEGGELALEAPTDVNLVAGRGLRVVCTARLHWVVLGLHVPVAIDSVTVLLIPEVRRIPGSRDSLVFHVQLESLSVSALPSFVEGSVVERINSELTQPSAELVWDFSNALSHRFELPRQIHPSRLIDVEVAWGSLRITDQALVFAVSIHAHGKAPGPTRALAAIPASRVGRSLRSRFPAALAVAGVFVFSLGALGLVFGVLAGKHQTARFLL